MVKLVYYYYTLVFYKRLYSNIADNIIFNTFLFQKYFINYIIMCHIMHAIELLTVSRTPAGRK